MGYLIGHIRVGDRKVGIVGLEDTLKAVQQRGLTGRKQIVDALIATVRKSNYIPAAAAHAYGEALHLAYRRFLGEEVPEEQGAPEIRIYGGD